MGGGAGGEDIAGEMAADQGSSSDEGNSGEDQPAGICVSCIGKPALHVLQECGHLVYCSTCRRKAVAKQLKDFGGQQDKMMKPGQLRSRHLERTRVRCPICREEGILVAKEKYTGVVFAV